MITEIQRQIIEHGVTVQCDECGRKETKYGAKYIRSFDTCSICKHHFCENGTCGKDYTENGDGWQGEYYLPDFRICKTCIPKFEPIWEKALDTVPRGKDIVEWTKKLLNNQTTP